MFGPQNSYLLCLGPFICCVLMCLWVFLVVAQSTRRESKKSSAPFLALRIFLIWCISVSWITKADTRIRTADLLFTKQLLYH